MQYDCQCNPPLLLHHCYYTIVITAIDARSRRRQCNMIANVIHHCYYTIVITPLLLLLSMLEEGGDNDNIHSLTEH